MKAIDAMIVWHPNEAPNLEGLRKGRGRLVANPTGRKPEVHVFANDDQSAHRRYDHLPCSLGACLHDWMKTGPAAEHIFRTFLCVLEDGVPMADVHREFLNIDEYAAMIGGHEFFGVAIPERDE